MVIFTRGILVGPLSIPYGDVEAVERLFYPGTLMSYSPEGIFLVHIFYSGICSYRHFSQNSQYLSLAYTWQTCIFKSSFIMDLGKGCKIMLAREFTYVMFISNFQFRMGFIAAAFRGVFANLSLIIKGQLWEIFLNNSHAGRSIDIRHWEVTYKYQNSIGFFNR